MAKNHRMTKNARKKSNKSSHHLSQKAIIEKGMRTRSQQQGMPQEQIDLAMDISDFCSDSALEWLKTP